MRLGAMLNRTRIVTRLFLAFSLILLATLFLGIMGARSIARLAELTADIFQHPFTVSIAIREIRSELLVAQRIMTQLVNSAGPAEVDLLERKLIDQKSVVDRHMAVVRDRFLGDKATVDRIDRALAEWRAARDKTVGLARSGRRAQAIALNEGRDALLAGAVMRHVGEVSDFATRKAAQFKQAAEREGDVAVRMISIVLVLMMAAAIAVALLIIRSIRRSLRHAAVEVQKVIDASAERARVVEAISAGDLSREMAASQPLKVDLERMPDDEMGALLKAAVRLSEVQCTVDEAFGKMTRSLRQARDTDRDSQEQLRRSNQVLAQRARILEQQREDIRAKNREIEIAHENLRHKAAKLERASTYKSQFLANMSHELRTPLNSLMILAGILAENGNGRLSRKQVEYASTIRAAGQDLLAIINDILDLSRIESGKMQLHFADIAVADLCDALQALFQPQADQKGLAFQVETDAGVPAVFAGDENRIHQVLKNLLSNAVKFTEKGKVTLRVATPALWENPLPVPAMAFVVSDTGIGVSPAKQLLIFDAFQQADGSISREYGGTGLGLTISLQLARAMRGDIRMSSREGEGSVFTLYLPLVPTGATAGEAPPAFAPALPAPGTPTPPAAGQTGSPCYGGRAPDDAGKVLLVDDDRRNMFSLSSALAEKNMTIIEAENGREALARLGEHPDVDIVLMDIMMPEMDGYTAMREIRRDTRLAHVPIIAMTAKALKGDYEKCIAAGASDYIAKPIEVEKLVSMIRAWQRA